ncbi:hypothetical protein CVS40_11433 [Lucilia cuprina]|nr:hypothetical protein CVS40_11433 [Lucilia cuprina]
MPSTFKAIDALPSATSSTAAAALASLSTTYRYNNTILLPSLEERLQTPLSSSSAAAAAAITTFSISPSTADDTSEINSSTGLTSISHVASVVVSNFLPLSSTSLSSSDDDTTSADDTKFSSTSSSSTIATAAASASASSSLPLSSTTFYPSYSPPVVESLVASSAEEFSNNFRDLSFDIFDDNDNDLFGSPLAFDASENGLWNGRFVPPPPRPPFFVDEPVLSDGLTTCDLCSWAMPTKSTFIFEGTMEKASELGWPLTLTIVSILSAILGAIIMIAVVKCRSPDYCSDSRLDYTSDYSVGHSLEKKTSHQRSGKCQHHSPKQQLPLPSIDQHHNHLQQQQQHLNHHHNHLDHENINQHHNLFYPPPTIANASHQYLLQPAEATQNFKQLPLNSHHHQLQQQQQQQHHHSHKRPLGMMHHIQHQQQHQRPQQQLDHHLHHHPRTVSSSSSSNDNSSNCTTQTSLTTLYQTKSHNELKSLNIERENSMLKRPLPPRPDERSEEENEDDDDEDDEDVDDDESLMPEHYVYEEPTMQESITAVVVVAASGNGMDTHVQWWSRNKRPNGNNNHLRRSNIYTAHPADSIRGLQQPNSLSASSSMTAMTTAMTVAPTAPSTTTTQLPYYHPQQIQQHSHTLPVQHVLGNQQHQQQYLQQFEHEHEYHQPQELQLQLQPQQQLQPSSHFNHPHNHHHHQQQHNNSLHHHHHHTQQHPGASVVGGMLQHGPQHQHSASMSSSSTNSMPSLSTQPLQMQIPEQIHLQKSSNQPQHVHMQHNKQNNKQQHNHHLQQQQNPHLHHQQQHEQDLELEQSSSDLHDNMFHWPTATSIQRQQHQQQQQLRLQTPQCEQHYIGRSGAGCGVGLGRSISGDGSSFIVTETMDDVADDVLAQTSEFEWTRAKNFKSLNNDWIWQNLDLNYGVSKPINFLNFQLFLTIGFFLIDSGRRENNKPYGVFIVFEPILIEVCMDPFNDKRGQSGSNAELGKSSFCIRIKSFLKTFKLSVDYDVPKCVDYDVPNKVTYRSEATSIIEDSNAGKTKSLFLFMGDVNLKESKNNFQPDVEIYTTIYRTDNQKELSYIGLLARASIGPVVRTKSLLVRVVNLKVKCITSEKIYLGLYRTYCTNQHKYQVIHLIFKIAPPTICISERKLIITVFLDATRPRRYLKVGNRTLYLRSHRHNDIRDLIPKLSTSASLQWSTDIRDLIADALSISLSS